ncbi:MAG: flagellar hook-basal body complex protein [Roseivivax sp.]|nr:flagellar hook-basal body complex protein [Roseivivax sp.]
MDNAGYATLTRQSGLMREIRILANNMANANTTGYREEGVLFSEFIRRAGEDGSVSMTTARIARTILDQGPLRPTAGTFDVAIDGDGFFVVQTDAGERLTRAGSFTPDAQGDLVTPDGNRVLDAGGAPIFIPPDAGAVAIAGDGTISAAGRLLGQIGVVVPTDPLGLEREGGVLFRAEAGWEVAPDPRVSQGFVEQSNVDPVGQLSRMIAVQRAYELGQSFLDAEDQRVRTTIQTLVK